MKRRTLLSFFLINALLIAGCGSGAAKPSTGVSGLLHLSSGSTQQTIAPLSLGPAVKKMSIIRATADDVVPNEKVVTFRPGLSATERAALARKMGGRIQRKLYGTEATYLIVTDENSSFAKTGQNLDGIERVEENALCYPLVTPNDEFYHSQKWHYEIMDLPAAWEITTGSDDIIVAVIDTGIAPDHPEFEGRLVAGWDFVDGDDQPHDDTYLYINEEKNNEFSHGTIVASIIGARTNNAIGVAAVAWNVKIMPIRVIPPAGSAQMSVLVEAINWAVEHGANVINLSLGSTTSIPSVEEAINNAVLKNVTVIAATGNEKTRVCYPARYDACIAVGALDANRQLASYSNYGAEVDFVAPGGEDSWVAGVGYNIKEKKNTYAVSIGTSLAAPHISGLAALLYARGYNTPQQVISRLKAASIDLGDQGKDKYYGYGLPRAIAALYDFSPIIVYLETEDGTPLSTPVNSATNGTYAFHDLTAGTVRVCAWLDKNNNGLCDAGDLFGSKIVTIQKDVMLTDYDITLTAVP